MKRKIFAGLMVAAIGSLMLSSPFQAGEPGVFSHKKHMEDADGCQTCHLADPKSGAMGMKPDACAECHDEGVPGFRSIKPPKGMFLFPHGLHVDAAECKDCHAATIEGTRTGPIMDQGRCMECHKENGVEVGATDCVKCHGRSAREIRPADHTELWKTTHGKEAGWRVFDKHGSDCNACHTKAQCRACHTSEKPASHTALWRLRTHGTSASWDRDSCRNCHETGTCVACHKTTAPINHTAGWSSRHGLTARTRADQSCTVCHEASQCAACHTSGR